MPSPFPGMDPYIETSGVWEDFHQSLVVGIHDQLAEVAPHRYVVRTAKRDYVVLVEQEGKKDHAFLPDVSVSTSRTKKKSPRQKGGLDVTDPTPGDAPVTMCAFIEEEHREGFVEIRESAPGHELERFQE